ncbi:hypothetical protein CLV65_1540 [Pseudoscardovia suis]|uniref:Uncharacterized protein n=2 Tax=Pseudoscardovia suis TaxID=987063 RepID=A0A261EPT3_9BIFI|nr:hypothetical protein PSSU_1685 [Pseudoscardovia suis]PJJ63917.1 hypothetical protein CLV65_1540 [Pseudoscardovia suis]
MAKQYYKAFKATDVRAYLETNEDPTPGDWLFIVRFMLPDGTRATINELGDWHAPADDDGDCIVLDNDHEDETGIRNEANLCLHSEYSEAYSLGEWDEATQSFTVKGPDKRVILNE